MGRNRKFAIILIFYTIFSIGCYTSDEDQGQVNKLRPEDNSNTNVKVDPNANVAEDSEVKLNTLINLPFEPEENDFQKEDNNKLTAVLRFSETDTEQLIEQLTAKGQPFATKIDSESWFPAELIAKSQMSGDESIKGTGYKADLFFKPPYNNGGLMRVDGTDYFVLHLQTK